MSKPKEKPILFSGEMVRAIPDGRKSMTRRVIKPQPDQANWKDPKRRNEWRWAKSVWHGGGGMMRVNAYGSRNDMVQWLIGHCPYGKPGDRLRLLTSWAVPSEFDELKPSALLRDVLIWTAFDHLSAHSPDWCMGKMRAGRFMPKFLRPRMPLAEITEVRVERVQEISEDDAMAEGICGSGGQWATHNRNDAAYKSSPRKAFIYLSVGLPEGQAGLRVGHEPLGVGDCISGACQ